MFLKLEDGIYVAGQITTGQVAEAARLGIRMIVNNRPDGEQPGQPSAEEIGRAAAAAGIAYRTVPVDHSGFRPAQVEAMRAALDAADGPVLAFCRSGTRSTFLWALAERAAGRDGTELMRLAAEAGYDLRPLAPVLLA